jgi:predicted small metal-binding protein
MARLISCECGHVIRAENDEDLLNRAEGHISQSHPELAGKVTPSDLLAMAEAE